MRYVEARLEEYQREEAYRNYVSTSLQLVPQSKWISQSYHDLLYPDAVEEQSGEEILVSLMARANLRFEE